MWANDPKMAKKWEKKEKKMKETKVRKMIRKMVREIMSEGFAGGLKKESDRKKFDNARRKNAEVLGYTLTGTNDVKSEIGDATIQEQAPPRPSPRRGSTAGGSRAIATKMDIDKNPFDEGPGLDQDDAEIEENKRESSMDIVRRIVNNHQYEKIQGVRVDATTANAILKVYNALSPKHQKTMEKLPIKKMVNIVWRLIK